MAAVLLLVLLGSLFVAFAAAMAPAFSTSQVVQGPESYTKYNYEFHIESPHDVYLASWRGDGRGDNVIFQGHYERVEGAAFTYGPSFYWYEVYLGGARQDGRPGTQNYEAQCPNERDPYRDGGASVGKVRFELRPCTFKLTGDATGILRVVLIARHCTNPLRIGDPTCGDVMTAAVDYALVESGATMMELVDQQRVYEEGDVVGVRIRTGGCGVRAEQPGFTGCYALAVHRTVNGQDQVLCAHESPTKKWQLRLQACDQTINVPSYAGATQWGATSWKTYQLVIPKGAFQPRDPFDNAWTIELLNEIVSARSTVIFTVDALDKIPQPPTVSLAPQPLIQGTRSELTIDAVANPNGTIDLRRARVYAWYGDSRSMPGLGDDPRWVPGFNGRNVSLNLVDESRSEAARRFSAKVDIVVPRDGNVNIEVVVIDTDSRASEPASLSARTIGAAPPVDEIPSENRHRTFTLVVLIVAAAAVIGALTWLRNPTHRWYAILAIGVGATSLIGWAYWTATGGFA